MEANHENPETQKTELVDRDTTPTAGPLLWRGDAQCGWRLFADPTDSTRYRHCRHHAGHNGPHEPCNGGPQGPGELWWQFPSITGTTIAELEGAARVASLVFVAESGGGWCIEIHRESDGFRAEASRPGLRGYGAVTRVTRARTAYLALTEARAEAEAFDRQVLG